MSSPTHSAESSSNNPVNWRVSVKQSDRNAKVREISTVLASLEPGASTASKLRLAMQFEDTVFKAATSLADYHKKLTKRLKKLQKNYVPPSPQPQPQPTQPQASPSTGREGEVDGAAAAAARQEALLQLKQTYGESLLYILKHADTAIKEMEVKQGAEKAKQLQQHTDAVKSWAQDLGLLENTKPNITMSVEHLEHLKYSLQRRAENIRQHVVKLADTDQFMLETIQKMEQEFQSPTKQRANLILGENTRKRFVHMYKNTKQGSFDGVKMLTESQKEAQAPVPLQTRNQDDQGRSTALLHLNKMRAASTVFLAYMGIKEKDKIQPGTLVQAHKVAKEGMNVVQQVMRKYRQDNPESELKLEDAWMKPLVLASSTTAVVENSSNKDGNGSGNDRSSSPPPTKRPRHAVVVVRSRVLLTAGRKTPSNLIPALKRKRAILVRPPGDGSHLILEFGKAFVMTIYLVPLTVTLRAADVKVTEEKQQHESDNAAVSTTSDTASMMSCPPLLTATPCPRWTPLHYGLTNRDDTTTATSAGHRLTLWGAKGDYDTLGPLIQERLQDASAQATQVLRQCFGKAALTTNDFETEILEATALLEFLQVARTTFLPNWQDDDI